MAIRGREQHRQAIGVQPLRHAPRRTKAHPIHQRLQLDQKRPAALARHRHDAARGGLGRAGEEDRRRVLHFLESGRRHGEEAKLIRRPEAILGGAHDAVTAARLALEIQHRVHQVLEQARARDGALGHVTDDHHGAAGGLAKRPARRCTRAAARPRRRAARRCRTAPSGSNPRPRAPPSPLAGEGQDRRQIGLAHQAQGLGAQSQAAGAQAHLRHGLLAAGIDYRARLGDAAGGHLQEQRRLADPRLPAQKGSPEPCHEAPAQDPIELCRHRSSAARCHPAPATWGPGRPRPPERPPPRAARARRCAAAANSTHCTAGTGPAISGSRLRRRCQTNTGFQGGPHLCGQHSKPFS